MTTHPKGAFDHRGFEKVVKDDFAHLADVVREAGSNDIPDHFIVSTPKEVFAKLVEAARQSREQAE